MCQFKTTFTCKGSKLGGVMFRSVLFLLASLLATVTIAKSDLQSITYLTEEYPPYNFTENGELHGIAVDLLVAATARATQPVAKEDISVQPWARAYRTVLINKDTVLFSTTRTKLRENLFNWVGPISATRIGVIRDDVGEQLLLELGVPRNSMQESSYAATLAEQLYKGRIDLWAYEENVAKWWISKGGFNSEDFEPVYVLQEGELYYAFNKDVDGASVRALQQAIDALKHTSDDENQTFYQSIVSKYR
ncbi:substrate-binding periplasmic protein [Vibrio vulnificus]|uniref:substrate-binding periplasmic protein n=1 Tax=Vibrio vulnificus TaxID=672 RepID=UPI00102899C4|nr:transporter substrate-binding domain-containing protein [Vibrio vulnificus]MCU8153227.1 transporter substrate-binding domain-containing protein [Vibrio vulnificus]MCU8194140.1 transporter substrate-binding domain-containing protein [Vibrio vulnificus]RZP88507.1 amino acid ABC transporter substrate-binding protein [Vibrio vulnificus]RZQ19998.1 amino acid ABC transporter substrate-binding protein [Vibrio vulnificus]